MSVSLGDLVSWKAKGRRLSGLVAQIRVVQHNAKTRANFATMGFETPPEKIVADVVFLDRPEFRVLAVDLLTFEKAWSVTEARERYAEARKALDAGVGAARKENKEEARNLNLLRLQPGQAVRVSEGKLWVPATFLGWTNKYRARVLVGKSKAAVKRLCDPKEVVVA